MSLKPHSIDLNADLGEGFPHDEALLGLVTSASIACGAHAGNQAIMLETLQTAQRHGIAVGAHPGFEDREGFGRFEREMTTGEVEQLIGRQVDTLQRLADEIGIPIRFVKPHGALYNQAQRDPQMAQGIINAVVRLGLPVLGQPGSVLESLADATGVRFVAEGFPDRRYQEDGRLVPRTDPNAVLHDPEEVASQVVRLLKRGYETLCIHGDAPNAVANALSISEILTQQGIILRSFA